MRQAAESNVVLAFWRNMISTCEKERALLQAMPGGSKQWWQKSKRLHQRKGATCSIPALRGPTREWVFDAKEKANLFVFSFSKKCKLATAEINHYTDVEATPYRGQNARRNVTVQAAETILRELDEDSGTGPDRLPAKILKRCHRELALPIQLLTVRILKTGTWPLLWLLHWVVPLFKKHTVFNPGNYRRIP